MSSNLKNDSYHSPQTEVRDFGFNSFQTEFDVAITCMDDVLENFFVTNYYYFVRYCQSIRFCLYSFPPIHFPKWFLGLIWQRVHLSKVTALNSIVMVSCIEKSIGVWIFDYGKHVKQWMVFNINFANKIWPQWELLAV